MPNWCSNKLTISGNTVSLDKLKEYVLGELMGNPVPFDFEKVIPIPAEIVAKKRENHFCIEKWGTKWNLDDETDFEDHDGGKEGTIVYIFQTAWSPPNNVLQALAEVFPELEMSLIYGEPGNGVCGELKSLEKEDYCREFDYQDGSGDYERVMTELGFKEIDDDEEE